MKTRIYEIKIGNNYYIGQDSLGRREKQHLNLLLRDGHPNRFMQYAYNKHGEFIFTVLEEGSFNKEELNILEQEKIKEYREKYGRKKIMNLTDGGDGVLGHIKTEAQIEASRKFMTERNPARKISRTSVLDIYGMIKLGESNDKIAKKMGLSSGYVSQIRIGDKYQDLFEEHFDKPIVSPGRQKMPYSDFLRLLELKEKGLNNKEIGEVLNLDTSIICRIVNKKTYKVYWEKYLECVERLSKG